ncbi:MAG: hypothetical protein AAF988_05195 [Pseudomonadota bacterium]
MASIFDPKSEEIERYLAEAKELAEVIYSDEDGLAADFMENSNPKTLGTHGFDEQFMSPEELIKKEGKRGYVVIEKALIEIAKIKCKELFSEAVHAFEDEEAAVLYLFANNKDFDSKKPIVVAERSQGGKDEVRQNMGYVAHMRAA